MLNNIDKISIFWDESALYIFAYGVYAIIVCAVVFIVESKRQGGAGSGKASLALSSVLFALLATLLFGSSLLAAGWYAGFFGGEIGAFVVTLTITVAALYHAKAYLIARHALHYDSPLLPGIVVTAILIAPYALFSIFIYLLASGMRN